MELNISQEREKKSRQTTETKKELLKKREIRGWKHSTVFNMKTKKERLVADYIVVGLGAAGALMVNKLAQRYHVIGIETGPANLYNTKPIRDSTFVGVEFGLEEDYFSVYFYQQQPVRNGSLKKE